MTGRRYAIRIRAGGRTLVDAGDIRLSPGRVTVLLGESGIGKSLIARAIAGLLDPEDFDVVINGIPGAVYQTGPDVQAFRRDGFFVFQEPSTHLNPLLPLGEQLREGSLAAGSDEAALLRALWEGDAHGRAAELLGVYPKPYRPSGGEKQRMFLAMALMKMDIAAARGAAAASSFFVFDEPTGSLDNRARNTFLALLLERYRRTSLTILLITHDYSMISELEGKHRDLLSAVDFRELRRVNGSLELFPFDPGAYTEWLRGRSGAGGREAGLGPPVLTVESPVSIFGRTLTMTRSGGDAAPLTLHAGTTASLKAPSGTGKTALMKMLMGLIRGERFRARLGDLPLDERTPPGVWRRSIWGRRMTMVFQHADEALNPRAQVRDVFRGLPGGEGETVGEVRRALAELFDGEPDASFLSRRVSMLSGGQKQRLNLARGLALHPDVLLLDEPLNGLDFETMTRVIGLLERKREAGPALLIVSHNEEIVDTMVHPANIYSLQVT